MSQARRVVLNTAYQTTGQIAGFGLSLATFIALAETLGASGYGEYTIIMTYLGLFAVAADWSMYLLVVKGLTSHTEVIERQAVFGRFLAFRLTVGGAALALGAVLVWFFPYSPAVQLGATIGALAFLASGVSQLVYSIFQAEQKLQYTALYELTYKVLLLGSVLLAGVLGTGLLGVVVGMVAAAVLTLGFATASARRFLPFAPADIRITWREWRETFSSTWALGLNGLLATLVFRIDILILSFFTSATAVGVYGMAAKIIELLSFLSGPFLSATFPVIAARHAAHAPTLAHTIQRTARLLLMLASLVSMVGFVLAAPIVVFVGGIEFAEAASAVKVLTFFPLFAFFGNYFYHLGVVFEQQQQLLVRTVTMLVMNVGLNLLFIPRYGYIAAAVTTVITEAVGAVMSGVIIYRAHPTSVLPWSALTTLLAAVVTGAAGSWTLGQTNLLGDFSSLSRLAQAAELAAGASLLGLTYLALLWATGVLTKHDLAILRARQT